MIRRALTALLALTMTIAWLVPAAHAKQRDSRGGDTRVIGGQQSVIPSRYGSRSYGVEQVDLK